MYIGVKKDGHIAREPRWSTTCPRRVLPPVPPPPLYLFNLGIKTKRHSGALEVTSALRRQLQISSAQRSYVTRRKYRVEKPDASENSARTIEAINTPVSRAPLYAFSFFFLITVAKSCKS